MREIKFRAWDKTNKVMEYNVNVNQGTAVKEGYQWYSISNTVCDSKLMQYTGLKDKNGEEIYEGDILNIYQHGHVVAEFAEGCYGAWDHYGFSPFRGTLFGCGGEVIGNIYENPELMT